jgi:hypothetical protein
MNDNMIDYESLSNTLNHFAKGSYPFEFQAEPSGLYCARLNLRLTPDEFDVAETYRFRETDPAYIEQALFLISSFIGIKGTLVLTVDDVYTENMSFEMAQKLRTDPYGEWICS